MLVRGLALGTECFASTDQSHDASEQTILRATDIVLAANKGSPGVGISTPPASTPSGESLHVKRSTSGYWLPSGPGGLGEAVYYGIPKDAVVLDRMLARKHLVLIS